MMYLVQTHLIIRAVPFLCLWFLSGCAPSPSNDAELDPGAFPKIDVHAHYTFDRDYYADLFEEWAMRAVAVDVAEVGSDDRSDWEAMLETQAAHPDMLLVATSFDADRIDDPDYEDRIIEMLREDIRRGAVMVKVWKDFGMVSKDASGRYVQIDDPRLQPVWDFLSAEGIPVMAHIGEPRIAWQPLEGNEGKQHYGYFANNPEYHAYKIPGMPSWEEIMAARDRWLDRNPDLTVIGAHLGSMAYDVDVVAERLDAYPNFFVDTAARFGDLTSQDSEKVRAFFIQYADRILYGTDMGVHVPADQLSVEELSSERASREKMLALHWRYFTSDDAFHFDSPMISQAVDTHGLNLPEDALRRIYFENAVSVLGLEL